MIKKALFLTSLFSFSLIVTMDGIKIHKRNFSVLIKNLAATSDCWWQQGKESVFKKDTENRTIIHELNTKDYSLNVSLYVKNALNNKELENVSYIQSYGEIDSNSLEIISVYTFDGHRDKKYATSLLKNFLNISKDAGYKKVTLQSVPKAVNLYSRLGFVTSDCIYASDMPDGWFDEEDDHILLTSMYKTL